MLFRSLNLVSYVAVRVQELTGGMQHPCIPSFLFQDFDPAEALAIPISATRAHR